jgi:hypothetical protein
VQYPANASQVGEGVPPSGLIVVLFLNVAIQPSSCAWYAGFTPLYPAESDLALRLTRALFRDKSDAEIGAPPHKPDFGGHSE